MNEESLHHRIEPDLEARIVALVLDEVSELERDQLNRLIDQRPELQTLKTHFESVDGLMREVAAGDAPPDDGDWKLPTDRRREVLAVINGPANKPNDTQHLSRLPKHGFWNVTRIAVSLSVAGLFLMLASGTFFLLGDGRRVGQMATDSERDFATFDVAEAASEGSDAPSGTMFFAEREELDARPERSYRTAQTSKPAEPASGLAFGDTTDSKSSLSAIRDSLGVDAIAMDADRTSADYLQDDVQYYPTAPELALPDLSVADEDFGLKKGQTLESPPMMAAGPANLFGEEEPLLTDEYAAFDATPDSAEAAKAVPNRGTVLLGGVTRSGDDQSGPVAANETNHWARPNGRSDVDFDDKVTGLDSGLESGGRGFGRGGYGGAGFGGGALKEGEVAEQLQLESPEPLMAGMEMMDGMGMTGEMEMMKDAYGQPAEEIPVDRLADSEALSFSIENAENAPITSRRNLAELGDLALTSPANQDITKWNAPVPRFAAPTIEDRTAGQNRVSGRSVPAEIAGKDMSLGAMPADAPKQDTRWGGEMKSGSRQGLDATLEGFDKNASADGAGVASNREKGLQQQRGQVAANVNGGFWYDTSEERYESKLLKRSSVEKSPAPAGLNEKDAAAEAFSTFSLHVSDVSFKLAAAALAQGEWPDAAKIRIEEFVNALDYGDPMPSQDEKVACQLEQAIHPFLQQRNLMRVSMRTAAAGRASNTPLRLTFLLDNSGSMERIDRQQTVRRAFALLAQQLMPLDQVTLISFARQPRLLADKVDGAQTQQLVALIDNLPSEGGTNIEAALQLAFEKAREQQTAGAQNRIILLTDGAVNLGDANPDSLSQLITTIRDSGIAFDAAGIVAEGLNDEILEALTRKGDGRYYLLDSADDADDGFTRQIAGALRPSAKNVKVQIEFNPKRVGRYKLLGFEKHVLKTEDFRNDKVDAAEMAAAEAGVAVYQFQAKPDGEGDVGSVSVRFRDLSTGQMIEKRWPIPYEPDAPRPDQATPSVRIATAAALFAAKLRGEPLGANVDLKTLSDLLSSLPDQDRNSKRVQQLQMMIGQARQQLGN